MKEIEKTNEIDIGALKTKGRRGRPRKNTTRLDQPVKAAFKTRRDDNQTMIESMRREIKFLRQTLGFVTL